MNTAQNRVIELIEQQQKGIENTAPWYAGEQLKDICKKEPHSAELLAKDLEVAEMSISHAEKKIKEWADKQKRSGNCVFVPPQVAEGILRKFYGLQEAGAAETINSQPTGSGVVLDLTDFL